MCLAKVCMTRRRARRSRGTSVLQQVQVSKAFLPRGKGPAQLLKGRNRAATTRDLTSWFRPSTHTTAPTARLLVLVLRTRLSETTTGPRRTSSPTSDTSTESTARIQRSGTAIARSPSSCGSIRASFRSEEHTSELQSRGHLVCRLLLEKKNK